jgi:hypothetical protein
VGSLHVSYCHCLQDRVIVGDAGGSGQARGWFGLLTWVPSEALAGREVGDLEVQCLSYVP